MLINGKYTTAKVMTDCIEQDAINQIKNVCDNEKFRDSKIRIMPDVHSGKGCTIGFTAKVKDFAIPNLVGVDISCSISTYKLNTKELDFNKLDDIIRNNIGYGMNCRETISSMVGNFKDKVASVCNDIRDISNLEYHLKNIGTIGGGNHFIEVNQDKDGYLWLTLHFGSRNLGKKICDYHQGIALKRFNTVSYDAFAKKLKETNPQDRQKLVEERRNQIANINSDLFYIEGDDLNKYIGHMLIAEEYASLNHKVVLHEILSKLNVNIIDSIFTNHNYIELLNDGYMIRKGSISAKKGQRCIIPLNMADGSLICVGKGNDDWNCSAPHGAGRVLSRGKAKENLSLDEFKERMKNIYTTCVNESTLDESPMAYKDKNIILNSIGETVDIIEQIKPVYNFKAN